MGSLEELTGKIIEDGKLQAQRIINEAIENSKKELEQESRKSNQSCEDLIKAAEVKADELYKQICAEKEMEIRDKNLFMKQRILDQIFQDAFMQLKDISIEEYKEILQRMIADKDLSNYILILPDRFLHLQEEMYAFLTNLFERGKFPSQVVYKPLAGGFILIKDGVEENYTFEAWIDAVRQEMESKVIDILYGKE
ncbi:MAG TPA: V-type ATP synthase subunit E [Lachnospiraceae bacterium]|nr:V-type ATP synthase subunit E [Lachnospiraceae bacterium]